MIARGTLHSAARLVRMAALVVATAGAFPACDKVPLTAPTESTIALFATGASVPANGSVDIVATVIESSGTAVQNGTVVTFTTTLGTISPAEARTNNGKVTVKLSGDGRSGTASIVAFSGGTQSDALELPVGGAAADNIVLTASPSSVPAGGGTVTLTAIVRDASGNALAGVPVTFSTTAGTLSQSTVTSDTNGQATTTLSTTRDATVTAAAGAKTATLNLTVTAAPTVSVSVSPATPAAGQAAVFTITVTPATNGAPVQSVTIDYGDGSQQALGSGSTSASHIYSEEGTYTVRVTVRDTDGQESSQVLVIVVTPPAAIPVTVAVNTTAPVPGSAVSFTATATAANSSVARYEWNFGDGQTATTSGPTTTHVYNTTGTFIVQVHAVGADGSEGDGQTSVVVNAAP
jgi:PKD repeat protein